MQIDATNPVDALAGPPAKADKLSQVAVASRPLPIDRVQVSSQAKTLASGPEAPAAPERKEPDADKDDKQQAALAPAREAARNQAIAAKAQRIDLIA